MANEKITKIFETVEESKDFFFGRYFSINIFYCFTFASRRVYFEMCLEGKRRVSESNNSLSILLVVPFYCSTIFFLFYFVWSVFPSCYFLCCFLFVSSNNNRRSKGQNGREREREREMCNIWFSSFFLSSAVSSGSGDLDKTENKLVLEQTKCCRVKTELF